MFGVLFVCTGNVCRSPAAQALLRAALDDSVTVASAGTSGLRGAPLAPPMAALLAADGLTIDGFASRTLTTSDVRDADLVLTLTGDHRALVLEHDPVALRRTLSLGELARLASAVPAGVVSGDDDAARLRSLVRAALGQRHLFPGQYPQDDVVDPFAQPDEVYAQAYAHLKGQVRQVLAALRR